MTTYQFILSFCLTLLMVNVSEAQVKFKLAMLEDGRTYQVSLVPEMTFESPMNITSTAQVTLRTPADGFEVDQIFNLLPNVIWEPNSKTSTPDESPEYDYISFGLITAGTNGIVYEAGVEVPLFAFTNYVDCKGAISLIDNETDPFAPPNSMQVNVGNQITILGAHGDAYIGNLPQHTVTCEGNITSIEQIDKQEINLSLFPNPTHQLITMDFDWDRRNEAVQMNILNITGAIVHENSVQIKKGTNVLQADVSHLAQGNYFIELIGADWKISSDQFIKIAK